MAFKNRVQQLIQNDRFKNRIILLLIGLLGYAFYKISNFQKEIIVYTAPDISNVFVQKVGEVPDSTIYGFARTIWENINFCQTDCNSEIPKHLDFFKAYLTSSCYNERLGALKYGKEAMQGRSRMLLPTAQSNLKSGNIKQINQDTWHVKMEFLQVESVLGVETRREQIVYPIRVVRSSVPQQYNKWRLEIDCYWEEPYSKLVTK